MYLIIENVAEGIIAGIAVSFLLARFKFGRQLIQKIFGGPFQVATTLSEGGITRMTLSRADYHKYRGGAGQLREYLALAKRTIDIVSISLNVTQAEGALIALFKEKILSNPTFRVRITLLAPSCPVAIYLAKSLDLEPNNLRWEIEDTLRQLTDCKRSLGLAAQDRLLIYVHETLPIGSAILLDATPDGGRIQVETKLYRAPRTESFGFEVVGPSPFYGRNFAAWQAVFTDSKVWQKF